MACDVDLKDGRIAAVTIANKDGLTRIEARQVIDCTGDGALLIGRAARRSETRRSCR